MLTEKKITDLYKNLSRELLIYIYRFTGSKETSEDLLQDCFINLIDYSQKHEIDNTKVRAFLYRTAHNISINYIKKNSRTSFIPAEETISIKDDFTTEIEFEELNNFIYNKLEGLDELSRSIFIMKKELNMPVSEIAKITNKSERTIRRKLEKTVSIITNDLKKSGFLTPALFFMPVLFGLIVLYYKGNDVI